MAANPKPQTETEKKPKWDDEAEKCATAFKKMIDSGDRQDLEQFCRDYAIERHTRCKGSTIAKKLNLYRAIWDPTRNYFRKT